MKPVLDPLAELYLDNRLWMIPQQARGIWSKPNFIFAENDIITIYQSKVFYLSKIMDVIF